MGWTRQCDRKRMLAGLWGKYMKNEKWEKMMIGVCNNRTYGQLPKFLYLHYIQPQIIYHKFYIYSILTHQYLYNRQTLFYSLIDLKDMKQATQHFLKRYSMTFGETSITDVSQCLQVGTAEYGFSVPHLRQVAQKLYQKYSYNKPKMYNLSQRLPQQVRFQNQAAVLYLPGFANHFLNCANGADLLYEEQQSIPYDRKYYDIQKKVTLDKQGKYNMVFRSYEREHDQTYKDYTITNLNKCRYLNQIKQAICQNFSGEKVSRQLLQQLHCEGNQYFDHNCGIEYHGDTGRKIVVGVSLGRSSVLRYCWKKPYDDSLNYLPPIDIELNHGDLFVMSEKASGQDCLDQSLYRVLHAAGSAKYIDAI